MALIVTGVSGGVALVAGLLTSYFERTDPDHGLVNAGWLAFPAGLVAVGGLVVLLAELLVAAMNPSRGQGAAGPHRPDRHRPVGAPRLAVLVYAVYLLVGALGVIAFTVSRQAWSGLWMDAFLLLCVAAFCWGVTHLQESVASPGQGRLPGLEPGIGAVRSVEERQSLRRWGLAVTGIGAGIAIAMLLLSIVSVYVQDTGLPYGLFIFAGLGYMVAAGGLVLLVVDGLLRLSERRIDRRGNPGERTA